MWLSLQILFVYFLTLPSLLHPSIYSIVFILVLYTVKNIFQSDYSPFPNLEGTKDMHSSASSERLMINWLEL